MPFNGDTNSRFERWSAELHDLYSAWNLTNEQFGAGARPGSPASHDDAALEASSPERYKLEGTGAGIDAVQMIDAAAQHLQGLQALVDARAKALSLWPLARAISEHVGHAVWLLEPDITPEARMARRWMARLVGAQRLHFLARHNSKSDKRATKKLRDSIREQVHQRFPDADLGWDDPAEHPLPPWQIANQTYPSLGQQTRLLSKFGARNIAGLYDTLSLSSHPNVITLSMAVEPVDAGGYLKMKYRTDPEVWGSTVRGASDMLHVAAHAACGYLHGQTDHLTAWGRQYRPQ